MYCTAPVKGIVNNLHSLLRIDHSNPEVVLSEEKEILT
jgi:hypothetical protein